MNPKQLSTNFQLLEAVAEKDYSKVERALDDGADVNFINLYDNGNTPLRLARSLGASEIVTLLLSKGASSDDCQKQQRETSQNANSRQLSSFSEANTYTKREGTANLGQFYETKLLSLVLLRALQDEQIEQFHLGTNLDEAGAFDDIVLRFTKQGKDMVYFLQAKHVKQHHVNLTDMVQGGKGAFSLQKYFESYVKIRKQFNTGSESVIFRGKFEDIRAEFILFTTTTINFKGNATPKVNDEANIFCTNPNVQFSIITGEYFIADFIAKIKEELAKKRHSLVIDASEACDEMVKDFFRSLVFCIQQSTEDKIDDLAIAEISKAGVASVERGIPQGCNTKFYSLKFLKLHDAVQEWWKRVGTVHFLSKSCDYLETAIRDIDHKPLLENLHSVSMNRLKSCGISFSLENIKDSNWFEKLTKVLNDKSAESADNTMYISTRHSVLTALKIIQYIEKTANYEGDFTFLNTEQFDFEYIVDAISTIRPPCLILCYNGIEINKIHAKIKQRVGRLVIIMNSEFGENWLQDESNGLSDLNRDSQDKILEYRIIFQGRPTSLRTLVGNDLDLVDAAILSSLIVGETIELASPREEEVMQYYVSRTFHRCALRCDILKSDEFFLISGESEDALSDNDRNIIVLSDGIGQAEQYYKQLCMKNPDRSIHLLSKSKTKQSDRETSAEIIWHKSQGSIAKLRSFIDENCKNGFKPSTVDDFENEVVILTAEPGMGKSSSLTSLAAESIAKAYVSAWIERINVLNHSEKFDEWEHSQKVLDKADVLEFILQISIHELDSTVATFSRNLLRKNCLERKLVLLVDGFDEISPNYVNVVLQLLKILKDNFAAKLLVTTRSGGVQVELENRLNTFACVLQPFTVEGQTAFLKKFFQSRQGIKINEARLRSYAINLYMQLTTSIGTSFSNLFSIPLQLKMIAITYEKEFISFHESNSFHLSLKDTFNKNYDLIQLYDKFINIQLYDILAKEKSRTDTKNPIIKKNLELVHAKILKRHELAAAYVLFNKEEKLVLLSDTDNLEIDNFMEELRTGDEKTGIVYQNSFGNLAFIHLTYAEYFAASLIMDRYATLTNTEFRDFFKLILIECLLRGNKTQICRFFQLKFEKHDAPVRDKTTKSYLLFEALMAVFGCVENLIEDHASKHLLKIVEYSISEGDLQIANMIKGNTQIENQSLFAAAASMGCNRLLNLVCPLVDVNEQHNGYPALYLAIDGNNLTTAQLLIQNGADVDAQTSDYGYSPLHLVSRKCFRNIAEILIQNGANVNARNNSIGSTPLYVAVENGSKEEVKLLLKSGVNVDLGTNYNTTPLHWAARKGYRDIAEWLIESGANVNARKITDASSPLHWAVRGNFKGVAKLLLEKGADVNAAYTPSYNGFTTLHWAAQKGFLEITELLIEHGADLEARSTDGRIPLIVASKRGHRDVVLVLMVAMLRSIFKLHQIL